MIQEIDGPLAHQLDRLEAKGRAHLRRQARRMAMAGAAGWALWTLPAAAAVCLVVGLCVHIGPWWPVIATALAGLVAAGVGALRQGLGRGVDRAASLALFDRQFGLKDRIVAADQFVAEPVRDGFRAAALEETRPWLSRALTAPLGEASSGAAARPRWPLALALVLLVLAVLWQMPWRAGPAGASRQPGSATSAEGGRGPAPAPTAADTRKPEGAAADEGSQGVARAPAPGADRPGDDAPAQPQADALPAARQTGAGSAAAGSEPARQAPAAPAAAGMTATAGADTAAATDGAPRSGGAGQQSAQADRQSAKAGAQASSKVDARGAGAADGQGHPDPARSPSSQSPSSQMPAGSAATAMSGQKHSPSQDGDGQKQPGRSKSGDQGSSQSGQGQGQGRDGQRSGDDSALKKTRGLAGLMLAVPMEDRLAGTPGPGRVASTSRPTAPQASRAQDVQAQARGQAEGDVGSLPHHADTAQEQRLLRAYFARPETAAGREAGTAPADAP